MAVFRLSTIETIEICDACRRDWSISTTISRSSPPEIAAEATPSTFSMASLIYFRQASRSSKGERGPVTLKFIIGRSKGLYFITTGSLASRGSLSFIRSIFSRTLSAAKSIFVPQLNSTITKDRPSLEIELILFTLLTVPVASSIILVIKLSISSGAAFW